jgi:NAD+ synthase (glutamine-hydrolysing)
MQNYGFIKVAAASQKLKVANVEYNAHRIECLIHEAHRRGVYVVVFPELSITGYTCGDLFMQKNLISAAAEAIQYLAERTKHIDMLIVVGLPVCAEERLYNCAGVLFKGSLIGLVPKMFLPNRNEFYEKRWFTSGHEICKSVSEIYFNGYKVPFGHLIFSDQKNGIRLGIEICEDLWSVIPPSSIMALNGANILANLSASNELVGKADYRRKLVEQQSARCIAGYIYSGSGVHESTTDMVFSGHSIISENGIILKESERFSRDDQIIYSDIDLGKLTVEKHMQTSYSDDCDRNRTFHKYTIVKYELGNRTYMSKFDRNIHAYPFVPSDQILANNRCEEVFKIQSSGLAKRIDHTGVIKAVIAVSGGIDSTLALLVTVKTFDMLGRSRKDIIAITMPGFGTTTNTYENSIGLMRSLNVDAREIDIKPACLLHMKDINHDPNSHDIVFENIQARERMQILMDIANKENGLVIGTSDLSELALGWTTYNGDHMSMYGVNSGVPKTLVKFLVKWIAENESDDNTRQILDDIIDTPISPELLPPDEKGRITQKTETKIGAYELHDFFLYHAVKWGMPPDKILFLAVTAFTGKYDESYIRETLKIFYARFFSQQFKRSALPDGPKVGSIGLSPRSDWRMPSDADSSLWLTDL